MIFACILLAAMLALAILLCVLLFKVAQARAASKQPACYSCGSRALHLSTPSGIVDQLLTNWHCVPYRCEVCSQRQYRIERGAGSAAED